MMKSRSLSQFDCGEELPFGDADELPLFGLVEGAVELGFGVVAPGFVLPGVVLPGLVDPGFVVEPFGAVEPGFCWFISPGCPEFPAGGFVAPGVVEFPAGGVALPAGGVAVLPGGVAVLPGGVAVLPGGVAVPAGGVAAPGVELCP